MADPTSTVIAVMDTVDAIQSRPLVQDPTDVTQRVRQVYHDQDVPLSEAVLRQAVAQHTPLVASQAAATPSQSEYRPARSRRQSFGFLEFLLVASVLIGGGTVVFTVNSMLSTRTTMENVAPVIALAVHQDVIGAQQAMSTTTAAPSLKKLNIDWVVGNNGGHTVLTLKHAPVVMAGVLSQYLTDPANKNQATLELRANGVLIKRPEELSVFQPCHGRGCATAYVDVTLTDPVTH